MPRSLSYVLACYFALTPWAIAESPLQSHESILTAIRDFIESKFRHPDDSQEVTIAPLDHRLRLAQCSQPLEVFTPPGAREVGAISVGVRCQGARPWSIYHKASIRRYQEVTVLKHSARQGAILTPSDITLTRKDAAQLRGARLSPEQIVNKPLRKSLPAGTVLTADHLTRLRLIKRGQKVLIRAHSANFEVSMSGVALMDGEEGQRIRVRNEESKRIVEGTVSGENVVSVTY
jgi:flagella basal body P-ring formation protein FlgA